MVGFPVMLLRSVTALLFLSAAKFSFAGSLYFCESLLVAPDSYEYSSTVNRRPPIQVLIPTDNQFVGVLLSAMSKDRGVFGAAPGRVELVTFGTQFGNFHTIEKTMELFSGQLAGYALNGKQLSLFVLEEQKIYQKIFDHLIASGGNVVNYSQRPWQGEKSDGIPQNSLFEKESETVHLEGGYQGPLRPNTASDVDTAGRFIDVTHLIESRKRLFNEEVMLNLNREATHFVRGFGRNQTYQIAVPMTGVGHLSFVLKVSPKGLEQWRYYFIAISERSRSITSKLLEISPTVRDSEWLFYVRQSGTLIYFVSRSGNQPAHFFYLERNI